MPRPAPVEAAAGQPDKPQALASFVLAAVVYGGVAGLLLAGPEDATSLPLWLLLLGPGASMLGIVLGLQGVGRAAAGARGMGYAVTALVLLVGPWMLMIVALAVLTALAILGPGPFG